MQANNILANVAKRRTSHPDAAPRRSMRRNLTAAAAGAVIAASMLAQPAASLADPQRAAISLAIRSHTGTPLPDGALLAVAVHEAGHAIGLPHSADTNDVMFPATRTGVLTERDRRTVEALYRLPTGPVSEFPIRR